MDLLPDPKLDYIQMSEPSAAGFLHTLHAQDCVAILTCTGPCISSMSGIFFLVVFDLISPLARELKQPRVITSLKD